MFSIHSYIVSFHKYIVDLSLSLDAVVCCARFSLTVGLLKVTSKTNKNATNHISHHQHSAELTNDERL